MGPYILINCDDDDNGGSHCGDHYIQDGDDNGPGNDGDRQKVCFENDRSNFDAKMVSAMLTIMMQKWSEPFFRILSGLMRVEEKVYGQLPYRLK